MPQQPPSRFYKPAGIALVSVLIAAAIVLGILTIMNASVLGEIRGGRDARVRNELVQAADGASELARIKLMSDFQASGQSADVFIEGLTTGSHGIASPGNGVQTVWAVKRKSPTGDQYGWIDVHTTASRGVESQTVIRRIGFGKSDIWKLAMLSKNTNCMYCHLRVNGDVGSLDHLRPGWGTEGSSGVNSGGELGGTVINGNLYANTVTADGTNLAGTPKTINGAQFTGNVNTSYDFSQLSDKLVGGSFPPIKRQTGLSAKGTLSGGTKIGVAAGGKITNLSSNVTTVNGVYNGNLVLIGTAANPIVLNKDIYVTGDVVIKGVVKGRGGIYAGRNLYIAGNVNMASPPDKIGQGACSAISGSDEAAQTACARANIRAGKDELRLASRGNTVIGDYTEQSDSTADPLGGSPLTVQERQSADYYRTQFDFGASSPTRYYDNATGDELTLDGATGQYFNVEGTEIDAANVVSRSYNTDAKQDAYTYSMRPGSINTDGSFSSWMNDSFYRQNILGSKNYTYNTWRTAFSQNAGESQSDYYTRIKTEMINSSIPTAQADAIACEIAGGCAYATTSQGDLLNASNNPFGYYRVDGSTVRVMVDTSAPDVTQVTQVDAFLYSNLRLAGKTSQQAMRINGGMIAKELGILAPGRTRPWWVQGMRYNAIGTTGGDALSDCDNSGDPYYVADTQDCALTVNYDWRLKSGGYGFGLVEKDAGQTLAWRLADNSTDKVSP